MKTEQRHWTQNRGWQNLGSSQLTKDQAPQLVLVFGGRKVLEDPAHYQEIKDFYPEANILMCSTAGEIIDTMVYDDSLALTAIHFEKTTLQIAKAVITDQSESESKGQELANQLPKDGLVHALIFTDGLKVNGTALVKGLTDNLPKEITVTGGMVGDGANFEKTLIGFNQEPAEGQLILIGLYGSELRVGHGSMGGWDPFGPERTITKSEHNVLYELDGQPALELYKKYLGDEAAGLPSTGLLFPLSLKINTDQGEVEVVRTLLSVDETNQSMTFAGDMPEGTSAKLMKATLNVS
ncbi:MAG: FIST N-terminal domain-containing protein [Candidatus Doudnabacteria bacterium]